MTIGHVGFLVLGLLAWGALIVVYAGALILRNRILAWDGDWKEGFEAREGRSLLHYEAELAATLRKLRASSVLLGLTILTLLILAALAALSGSEYQLTSQAESASLATLVALIAVAIPMPLYVGFRVAIQTVRLMALKVDGFIMDDMEGEHRERVGESRERNARAKADFDSYVDKRRQEILKLRAERQRKVAEKRRLVEDERRKKGDEKRKRDDEIEQQMAREELLKKVE